MFPCGFDGRASTALLDTTPLHEEENRGSTEFRPDASLTSPTLPPSPSPSHPYPHPHSHTLSLSDSCPTIRSRLRSRSPSMHARLVVRRKYTFAAAFLLVSLVSFTLQTELASYVSHELGWNKSYCMLYVTHGSWVLLWPAQVLVLRLRNREVAWAVFWRRHVTLLRTTALMAERQELQLSRRQVDGHSPWPYMVRITALVSTALTVAGLSWYVAINMTTPNDVTAIYNCSAFFAYAFSVLLLKERLRLDKSVAVVVAIVGVLVVAYWDTSGELGTPADGGSRLLGNSLIGAGSVLYGLYEVLYKRLACPPEGTSPGRGVVFAHAFASMIGAFTLTVLWLPLPLLHVLGWEMIELPTGQALRMLLLSVATSAVFAGSFLVLISLTSPVLGSVAALLTIFTVALVDWARTGMPPSPAALLGGLLIVLALCVLSWSTWREMAEDARRREEERLLLGEAECEESDKDGYKRGR